MKILIVGNGGREHALLWKLRRDAPDAHFFITRGNGGTHGMATPIPLGASEIAPLAGWALREGIDLTVVGPEVPLAEGIVDHFSSRGLPIFGPTRLAAELESSKAYAKWLMRKYGIPTAAFEIFTEADPARAYVEALGAPLVVKASGLAAGKGAVVCETTAEALAAVDEILTGKAFGAAGDHLVIEEFMRGEELSVFALCDGETVVTLLSAQDHKRIGEGDTGPNTGGMGAYAPVSIATPELLQRVEMEILLPTVRAMAEERRPYRGVLYAGIMITDEGPKVVEFNCRFGDPETQAILPLLKSSLLEPLTAVADGSLAKVSPPEWHPGAGVTTVLASGGYPGDYPTGVPIRIPPELRDTDGVAVHAGPGIHQPDTVASTDAAATVFHAGTEVRDGELVTSGGRVLAVTAVAPTVAEAAAASRAAAERIEFEGRTFRRDIAWREIERSGRAGHAGAA